VTYSLHPEAGKELAAAAAFYKERAGASLARAFLAEFERVAKLLVQTPGLGTLAPGACIRCGAFRTRSTTVVPKKVFEYSSSVISIAARTTGAVASDRGTRRMLSFSTETLDPFEFVRTIAVARVALQEGMLRAGLNLQANYECHP
jgi:plasmid stabilization system protein ParE